MENFLKISMTSKQFYFLIKSDNLWHKLLKKKEISEEAIEKERKTKSLMEIYKESISGWNKEASYHKIKFTGNKALNNYHNHSGTAVVKKSFISGSENVLFVFDYDTPRASSSCGIKLETT